jgi:hypothetical protein
MSVAKSLWASVQGDPAFMRRVNGWLTIFWIVMIPVSAELGLLSSVTYVSALSLWALVSGHWSAWQAARVEVEQQAEAKELEENPIEQRVVEHLIAQTDIEAANDAQPAMSHDSVAVLLAEMSAQLAELQRRFLAPSTVPDVQVNGAG